MEVMALDMKFRPRLVFAYADSAHAARCGRFFRRHGWETHLVASAEEARRLVDRFAPEAVVLDTQLSDESGWLTCAKITAQNPDLKVILLGSPPADLDEKLDQVGGWSMVSHEDGVEALASEVLGRRYVYAM